MLPIFAAAIVGGIGNPFGAFLGGYVIAFAEILITYAYKKFFAYLLPEFMEPDSLMQLLSTDYKFAVSFSILVIVLLLDHQEYSRVKLYDATQKYNCCLLNNDIIDYCCWSTTVLDYSSNNFKLLFNLCCNDNRGKYSMGLCWSN